MVRLLTQFIDNGIMLVAAAVLLRCYFKHEATQLNKRKWVPFAGAFLILYSLLEMGLDCREYLRNRLPSRKELEETILANNTIAVADMQYHSAHGYNILVPKGYAYTEFVSGPFSLTAIKGTAGLAVVQSLCPEPLDKIVPETCRYLKQKNSTYTFTDEQSITIGKTPATRMNVAVTKETGAKRGFIIFLKKDSNLFQLMLTCADADFADNRYEFESIIKSLTL